MSDPLVTCVMATMNRPAYARHAIKLFLEQSWPNKELIVVDDSVKDKQLDQIWDRRIKHVRLMDKMPLGEKHDIGNVLAQGEYIAYLDDDDWYTNDRLAVQVESMRRGNMMCGFFWDYVFFVQSGKWGRVRVKTNDLVSWVGNATVGTYPGLNFHDGTAMYSRLMNREMLRHGKTAVGEKQAFIVEAALRGMRFECLQNENKFVYLRHTTNYWRPENPADIFEPAAAPAWFPESDISAYRIGIP
jgi:glycosyltransferase involved in cell wall biosynthesis